MIEDFAVLGIAVDNPNTVPKTTIPRDGPLRRLIPKDEVFLLFPAKIYCGQSLLDARRESVIVDYSYNDDIDGYRKSPDSLAGRGGLRIRDEIRMVRPGLYLGRAYANRAFLLNFTLFNAEVAERDGPAFARGERRRGRLLARGAAAHDRSAMITLPPPTRLELAVHSAFRSDPARAAPDRSFFRPAFNRDPSRACGERHPMGHEPAPEGRGLQARGGARPAGRRGEPQFRHRDLRHLYAAELPARRISTRRQHQDAWRCARRIHRARRRSRAHAARRVRQAAHLSHLGAVFRARSRHAQGH